MSEDEFKVRILSWGLLNDRHVPEETKDLDYMKGVSSLCCGSRTTHVLTNDGHLYSWGYGGSRSFGVEDPTISKQPHMVEGVDAQWVSSGRGHTAIVTRKGKLYTYGGGAYFRLGHGDNLDQSTPKLVQFITGTVTQVSCGGCHTAAITSNGFLWTWGYGRMGALGHGNNENQKKPKVVEALKNVIQVSAGRDHTLALTSDGVVYSFGYGGSGALGLGDNCNSFSPVLIKSLQGVSQVVAGSTYSAALLSTGEVYTWGTSDEGVLGHSTEYNVPVPWKLEGLTNIVQIACGYFHMAALSVYGELYTWGNGFHGKIAQGKDSNKRWQCINQPRLVTVAEGQAISQISCGLLHTTALVDLRAVLNNADSKGDMLSHVIWFISKGEKYLKSAEASLVYLTSRPRYNLSTTDNSGKTILHWAVIFRNSAFVQFMFQFKGNDGSLNVNATDKQGNTAMHHACLNSDINCAKILIENNINLDICNEKNQTAFDLVDSETVLFQLKQLSGSKDAFISYGLSETGGTKFTQILRDALEVERIPVWMDEKGLRAGVKWLDEIKQSILKCHAFIFVVSKKSLASENCKLELEFALQNKKPIFPVIYEMQSFDSSPFISLKDYQWVDFTSEGQFDNSFKKLVKGLKDVLGKNHETLSPELRPPSPTIPSSEPKKRTGATTTPSLQSHRPLPGASTQDIYHEKEKHNRRRRHDHVPRVTLIHELGFGSFLARLLIGAKFAAENLGVELTICNAEGKRTNITQFIGNAIRNGTDVIVLNHGGPELYPCLEMAVDKGIKIITIDLNVENPLITEIQQDDFALAFLLCKQLVQDTNGNANLIYMSQVEINFAPLIKRDKVWQVYKWQYKGLNEVAMIGEVSANVVRNAKMETHKVLKQYPNVNTVLAMWDQFAHGAVEAIMEEGKHGSIGVYSIDVSDEVLENMMRLNSPWKCTVGLDSWLLGNMAIQCAWSWLAGNDLGKYLLLDPVVITQEFVLENNIKTMKALVKCVPELKIASFLKKYPFLESNTNHPLPLPQPIVQTTFSKPESERKELKELEVKEEIKEDKEVTLDDSKPQSKRFKSSYYQTKQQPPKKAVSQQITNKNVLAKTLGLPFI